jgi:hypothetical protein
MAVRSRRPAGTISARGRVLLFILFIFAAVAVACVAPELVTRGSTPAPIAPPATTPSVGLSRVPTAIEARLIRELMSVTERLRQLRFRAPVAVRIQDRSAMRAYVESALDETELARARRRYLALGLLDPKLDVRELISALMEEELVGYYDPQQKLLAIRDDVASSLSRAGDAERDLEWRATVVHELVHALQDQHLGLSEAMERERTTDEENAFGAVVEGDATLAMLGYLAERQGASLDSLVADSAGLARSLRDNPLSPTGRLAAAPAIVREPLLFRYRDGAIFAAYVHARKGWAGIDGAHRAQPDGTHTISEPARYLAQSAAWRVALPALPLLSEHGCVDVDRDVLGSLEIGAALASPALSASELSRSWRGDAYAVLRCGERDASIWVLRFSSLQAARKARATFMRLEDSNQTRLIAQSGSALLVTRHVPAPLASALEPLFRAWSGVQARSAAREQNVEARDPEPEQNESR